MQLSRPCDGIRVLAATSALAAPFAAYQLALHGAEVISIEDPGTGNSTRRGGSAEGRNLSDQGMAAGFIAHSSNKKSLTLNLREPEARDIYKKLARDTDVIIENFRAGTLDGLGLGYEAMAAQPGNPPWTGLWRGGHGAAGQGGRHIARKAVA